MNNGLGGGTTTFIVFSAFPLSSASTEAVAIPSSHAGEQGRASELHWADRGAQAGGSEEVSVGC